MGDKGLSPKTIANVHGLLSAAMSTAMKLGYRTDNPCVGVELPKSVSTRDEMTVLTRDEFALLLAKIPAFYQPLVLTLVATGLRWGEATALTAGDVDLTARPATIRVTKAWKRDADRRWYVGPPKTKRARRTVSLPDDLVDVLLPLVAGKAPDALLFTNTVGSQLSSSRFWTTTWTPALDAACDPRQADGKPDADAPRLTKRPRVHDLRHTHASWMIAAGTDLFVLQRRLGHESITTTTETYAHLLPDQQRAAADAAGRALDGLVPVPTTAPTDSLASTIAKVSALESLGQKHERPQRRDGFGGQQLCGRKTRVSDQRSMTAPDMRRSSVRFTMRFLVYD